MVPIERDSRLKAAVYAVFAFGFPVLVGAWLLCRLNPYPLVHAHVCRHVLRYGIGATFVLSFIGGVLFVIDAYRNERVPGAKRRLWVALLVFGGLTVMPFYWWWYVRPRAGSSPPEALAPGSD